MSSNYLEDIGYGLQLVLLIILYKIACLISQVKWANKKRIYISILAHLPWRGLKVYATFSNVAEKRTGQEVHN